MAYRTVQVTNVYDQASADDLASKLKDVGNHADIFEELRRRSVNAKDEVRRVFCAVCNESRKTDDLGTTREESRILREVALKMIDDVYCGPCVALPGQQLNPDGDLAQYEQSSLQGAAQQNDEEIVKRLLRRTPDTDEEKLRRAILHEDEDGKTALVFAILNQSPEIVELLIDTEPLLLKQKNLRGFTPLHKATHTYLEALKRPNSFSIDNLERIILMIARKEPSLLTTLDNQKIPPFAFDQERMKRLDNEKRCAARDWFLELICEFVKDQALESAAYQRGSTCRVTLSLGDLDFKDSQEDPKLQAKIFEAFVDRFQRVRGVELESTLAELVLPDMTFAGDVKIHACIRKLFEKLEEFPVSKIVSLRVWDNPLRPLPSSDIADIVERFQVAELDWYRINLDLEAFSDRAKESIRTLHLYSDGNWGSLFHWTDWCGFPTFPNLKDVHIYIVDESETYRDEAVQEQLDALCDKVKERRLQEIIPKIPLREDGTKVRASVEIIPKHQPLHLTGFRPPIINASDRFFSVFDKVHKFMRSSDQNIFPPARVRFGGLRRPARNVSRIKVAVIDNGFDHWQPAFQDKIGKAKSFDTGFQERDRNVMRPAFMASEGHGTQMASLIVQINPEVELWLYRINSGRKGHDIDAAVQAIEEATADGVDIMNLSWTINYDRDNKLKDAVEAAAQKNILIFASVSDNEQPAGNVYPAAYKDSVIRVMAADVYGRRMAKARRDVDVMILGQSLSTWGLSWVSKKPEIVSGSSAATALVSGLASVLLYYVQCANAESDPRRSDWRKAKQRTIMLQLLTKMRLGEPRKDGKGVLIDPYVLFEEKAESDESDFDWKRTFDIASLLSRK
ncbi:uncharacterized protein PV09_03490 [Verruconis gallopava]|uniref:Peptidase S8/S53 domain-containing protein n=1 Tax=Verruconis gallopava TaxID=253628 RepID=A0A0D2B2U6_9PEZI|nr:uncharacterized protein PV09_03490 [Verruconis gallopava]KIW05619.1 hypothetical protein PV09_03490 [Verruconis gallopava]